MTRLPIPGGDNGDWGQILNDFLTVSHNQDGTLAANSVVGAQIAADSIPSTKLDNATQTTLASVANKLDTTTAASSYAAISEPIALTRLPVFAVNNYASPSAAYAALVTAGGGRLLFSAGTTYTFSSTLTLNQAVPTEVTAHGAIIKPPANGFAFTLNAGRSQNQIIALTNLTIDCSGVSGGSGIKIVDHYGAVLRNIRILSPATGVLITDATGWSESSQLDNVYVKAASIVGIDLQTTGGTGSFGYANWGLVHIDNVPASAIGLRLGAGAGIANTTVGRLIIHSSADDSKGMQVAGDCGLNTRINAVIESLGASMTSAIALDIISTGLLDGCAFDLNIILPSSGGGWGTQINNPATRPIQIRTPRNVQVGGSATLATSLMYQSGKLGDTTPLFSIAQDGTLRWGAGGTTATDTTLSRSGSGALSLGGALQVNSGNLNIFGGMRLSSGATASSGTLGTGSTPAILFDATAGAITRTLYATTLPGYVYFFTKTDSSANTATIAPPISGTINASASSIVLAKQGDTAVVYSTATSGAWVADTSGVASLAPSALKTPAASKSGYWYYASSPTAAGTGAPTINVPVMTAFVVPYSLSIAQLAAEFTVAGSADSVFHVGIWADDGSGRPSTLVLDAGSISTGTGNAGTVSTGGTPGIYAIALGSALVLTPGLYWIGGACQGTSSPTMRTVAAGGIQQIPMPVGTSLPSTNGTLSGFQAATQTGALGTLSSVASAGTIPRILYKTS